MKSVHLVTKHKWYDLIDQKKKRIEYRTANSYWAKRLEGATHTIFHRGYSSTTMTWKIKKIIEARGVFEIHLGKRM